jgi:hypothetical protein
MLPALCWNGERLKQTIIRLSPGFRTRASVAGCYKAANGFVHSRPIVLAGQQFKGTGAAWMATYRGLMDVAEQLDFQLVTVRNNEALAEVEAILLNFAFGQRYQLRSSSSRAYKAHHIGDERIGVIFIVNNLFDSTVCFHQVQIEDFGAE